MNRSGYFSALFFYFAALPASVWLVMNIPGGGRLIELLRGGFGMNLLILICGILMAEGARRILRLAGKKRERANSLPVSERKYPLGEQVLWIILGLTLTASAAFLLSEGVLKTPIFLLQKAGASIVHLFISVTNTPSWLPWTCTGLVVLVGLILQGRPFFARKPPRRKTYSMEMYNPWLARIAIFSPERFVLRHFRKLIRTDFLNRFSQYTIFAGRIHCLHEGQASTWYVTYDERVMQSRFDRRMLEREHFERFINTLTRLEKKNARISHDIIADIVKEHKLIELAADPGESDSGLGDLTAAEVRLITHALASTDYNNILTLDVDHLQSDDSEEPEKRSQQTFNKRLQEVVNIANRSLMRMGGTYELGMYRRDKKLTTKVLQFRVDPQETLRKSLDEYGDKISPRHSLLYASIRGSAGEHGDGDFDDDEGEDADDFDDMISSPGGASTLDHIEELNPSLQQIAVEAKGFGRVYDIQLGKESYQVITEWLKSGGSNPVNGWRLFRCSKVIDSDGNTIARRLQKWRDLVPHLMGTVGLGKEWSHVELLTPSLYSQDKLALVLLALDAFEAHDFRNRKRILRARPKAEDERSHPEE
ncbi:MAG: hypothetical protein EOL87_10450 [Spartobacteria bacterium]|nr:hypothetical protein [Spartobacteria bacterium]